MSGSFDVPTDHLCARGRIIYWTIEEALMPPHETCLEWAANIYSGKLRYAGNESFCLDPEELFIT